MIEVYKIGLKRYVDNLDNHGDVIDKNGGYFEYLKIREAIRSLDNDIYLHKDMIIVINGLFVDKAEEDTLLQRMKLFKDKVFIASDLIAFKNNLDIIRNCNYLLHQAPGHIFTEFKDIQQYYSYVPELFYNNTLNFCKKDNLLMFGGGYRDNEDIITEYLNAVDSISLVKRDDNSIDTRLTYTEYIKEMSKHAFNLVISRKEYQEVGWVTPRFVESIDNDVLPIVDSTYDKNNYFGAIKCTPKNVKAFIDFFKENEENRIILINYYRHRIERTANAFKSLIKYTIGG